MLLYSIRLNHFALTCMYIYTHTPSQKLPILPILFFLLPTTTFATFVNGLGPGPSEFVGRLSSLLLTGPSLNRRREESFLANPTPTIQRMGLGSTAAPSLSQAIFFTTSLL